MIKKKLNISHSSGHIKYNGEETSDGAAFSTVCVFPGGTG